MPWDRVHDEAEVLEHVLSEELEALIAAKLGNPTIDPHGDPIPSAELELRGEPHAQPGEPCAGRRGEHSCASRTPTRRCCATWPSRVSARRSLQVLERQPFGGPLLVNLTRREHALGGQLASAMRVEVDDGPPLRRRRSMATPEASVSPSLPCRSRFAGRGPPLTAEDAARSLDRSRVHHARGNGKRWWLLWLLVGPGILAMLGENDGPSMIAYASDGAAVRAGVLRAVHPGAVRDGATSARRCACASARSPTAATASWCCSATGRSGAGSAPAI